MTSTAYTLVIPALNPDKRLIALVADVASQWPTAGLDGRLEIIIVDDGSRSNCRLIFDILKTQYGCTVCRHAKNCGKGAALKTGIARAMQAHGLRGVVTADADGQHSVQDILRVFGALESHPRHIVLGARDFSGSDVPFKSRWGNRITSLVFRLGTGVRCRDTQTGLRGLPATFLADILEVSGQRFDYEMNVLMLAAQKGISFHFVPIQTIYIEGNRASHFRPVADSVRIYAGILKFGLSSIGSAVLDIVCFSLLSRFLLGNSAPGILMATAAARVLSGTANFTVNRLWVFSADQPVGVQLLKYAVLFIVQMLTSAVLVWALSQLSVPLTLCKILVDGALFIHSYRIQRRYIFVKAGRTA